MPEPEKPPDPPDEWRTFTNVDDLADELELCRVPIDAGHIDTRRLLELNGSWASRNQTWKAQRRRQTHQGR
jgi:hypothetical protein